MKKSIYARARELREHCGCRGTGVRYAGAVNVPCPECKPADAAKAHSDNCLCCDCTVVSIPGRTTDPISPEELKQMREAGREAMDLIRYGRRPKPADCGFGRRYC